MQIICPVYTKDVMIMHAGVKEQQEDIMIEVLFGESEAASMKAAKSIAAKYTVKLKTIHGIHGPAAVWAAGRKKPAQNEQAGWLEGNAGEVVCLGFMLDIGDIKEAADSRYRKELIDSMYAQDQRAEDSAADTKDRMNVYADELARLVQYLKDGETVRIWYSDAPYSRCGYYHLCTLLQHYENEVYVIKLPEYIVRADRTIVLYKSWGEVAAEEFASFLPYEKKLFKEEVRMTAGHWSGLVEDNSPLRAVINGKVIGVPQDFYDFLIWKKLTSDPVREAALIGDLLSNSQTCIGDWWYAKRIEHYIRQGVIKVERDSEDKYARVICRQ